MEQNKKTPVTKKKKNRDKIIPVKKPYTRGKAYAPYLLKQGGKLLAYQLLIIFLNLMLGAAFAIQNVFLNVVTNMMLVLVYASLLYMDGTRQGESDVNLGEIVYQKKEMGKVVAASEETHCYHPLKGLVTVAIGTAILFVVALVFAVTAQKQVYQLQMLPSWTSAFSTQEEIILPLSYYNQQFSMSIIDYIRIFVRASVYPFVNIAGADNASGMLLVDRLSPLLIILPFLFYAVGYNQGPRIRSIIHGSIQSDSKRRKRKEKRERKNRNQNKPNQLV